MPVGFNPGTDDSGLGQNGTAIDRAYMLAFIAAIDAAIAAGGGVPTLPDTDASHNLTLAAGSNLTANRTLTLTTGDAARTLTLSGNPTLADWFDQPVKAASSVTFSHLTLSNGQIAFPSVQVASGIANTLDDYEEGAWTPVMFFGVGNAGITYATQAGTYVKVGQLVHFSLRLTLTSKGSSTGAAAISGFPFTTVTSPEHPVSIGYYTNMVASTGITGYVVGTVLNPTIPGATFTAGVTDANFTNTSDLMISGTYRATA
jgi:hypothetical protein